MKKTLLFIIVTLLLATTSMLVSKEQDKAKLRQLSLKYHQKYSKMKAEAEAKAKEKGWKIRGESNDGQLFEIMGLEKNGMPIYNITNNLNSAKTIDTDHVWNGGTANLDLSGEDFLIGEWDGGHPRATHQEFDDGEGGTRVTRRDDGDLHYHSAHVAGTLIAEGQIPAAKGMAHQANLDSYDWDDDLAEMALAAANDDLTLSNHSYGKTRGWKWRSEHARWFWYGDVDVSTTEDYKFGFYSELSQDWDEFAYNSPQYLAVKSAGNDRVDDHNSGHYAWNEADDEWQWSTDARNPDGDYDCIAGRGVAKNILTVGSIWQITDGYDDPADVVSSEFSCWGPVDDGRIKPDIVADGEMVYSTFHENDSQYDSIGGTSMATPAVTGSAALLQEHYDNLNDEYMLASTLKGLIIHTADEAGPNDGPDYMFGWGKMNTETAVDLITYSNTFLEKTILEKTLANGDTEEILFQWNGEDDIRATICWTDPAGTPVAASVDPDNSMLVNDLDIRLISENREIFYPWKLDKDSPADAATQDSDNAVDNVEQIFIENPAAGYYTLQISHKGNIGTDQDYSLIYSGLIRETTNRWTGDFNSYWSNDNNWSLGHVPLSFEDVEITTDGYHPVKIDFHDAVCYDLTIEQNATLDIKDQKLQVNDDSFIYGTLIMSDEPSVFDVESDVVWYDGSELDVSVNSATIYVGEDWEVLSGSDVQMNQGYLEFDSTKISVILIDSPNNSFHNIRVDKENAYVGQGNYAGVSAASDFDMNVTGNIYVYTDAFFRYFSPNALNLSGIISNQGGTTEFYFGTLVYDGNSHTINPGADDFFSSIEIACSQNATLANDIDINNDLTISTGTLNSNGYNIDIAGDWINNVGAGAFLESTGTVNFNSTFTTQACSTENFNKFIIAKSNRELQINGDVNCNEFDWHSGSMNILQGASFTANDLTDDGIYGSWEVTTGATVNLTQDSGSYADLNGSLIFTGGGEFNVFSSTAAYWGFGDSAHLEMDGGTLSYNNAIRITDDFTSNISGGTIKTVGYFWNESDNFLPTGGTVEMVGVSDGYIRTDFGHFHNLKINKAEVRTAGFQPTTKNRRLSREGSREEVTRNNAITMNNDLVIKGDFTLSSGTFHTGTYDMYVSGDWTNNVGEAAFFETTGTVIFNGANSSDILTNETFYNLHLDKTYAAFDALETGTSGNGRDVIILNNLHLLDGTLELNDPTQLTVDNILTIDEGAVLNANDTGTIEITIGEDWFDFNASGGFDAGNSSLVEFTNSNANTLHQILEWDAFNDIKINTSAAWARPSNDVPITCNNLHIQNGRLKLAGYNIYVENEMYIEGILEMSNVNDSLFVKDIIWEDGSGTTISSGEIFVSGNWQTNSGANPHLGSGNTVYFTGEDNSTIICDEPTASFGAVSIDKTDTNDVVSVVMNDNFNADTIDVNTGILSLSEGCSLEIGTELNVNTDGHVLFTGTDANNITVTNDSGYYEFSVNSGGIIEADYTIFSKMNTDGINIKSGSTIYSLDNCSFQNGEATGTLLTVDNPQIITIDGAEFIAGAIRDAAYSVTKNVNTGMVTFTNSTGAFSGPDNENDLFDRINWLGFAADLEITNVVWSNTTPYITDTITATVTVFNNGNLDIPDGQQFFTDFFYNEVAPPEQGDFGNNFISFNGGIPAGDFVELEFAVNNADAEIWSSYFLLDTDGLVTESNENNNVYGPNTITWNPLPVINDLMVVLNSGDIELIWTYPLGCDSFKVYRSEDPHDFSGADVFNTLDPSYIETLGSTKYFYRVTAVKNFAPVILRNNIDRRLRK